MCCLEWAVIRQTRLGLSTKFYLLLDLELFNFKDALGISS